jgi:hypothetical protein
LKKATASSNVSLIGARETAFFWKAVLVISAVIAARNSAGLGFASLLLMSAHQLRV